jgi:hypothetical protein
MSWATRPTAQEAARRCLALRIVIVHARGEPVPAALDPWREALSPWERALVRRIARSDRAQDRDLAAWQAEPLHALLFHLGQCAQALPMDRRVACDQFADFEALDPHAFLASARFAELSIMPNQMWAWRIHIQILIDAGHDISQAHSDYRGSLSFEHLVRGLASGCAERGMFQAIDEDFPAFGLPFRALNADQREAVRRITWERMRAIHWLQGLEPRNKWDRVPEEGLDPVQVLRGACFVPSSRMKTPAPEKRGRRRNRE